MTTLNITVCQKTFTWSPAELRQRLEALGNLRSRETAWICEDLSLAPSNCLSRIVWHYVAKYLPLAVREYLFGVNLDHSRQILERVKPYIGPSDDLADVYNRAVWKFNEVAPRHQVAEIAPPAAVAAPVPPNLTSDSPAVALIAHFEHCWSARQKLFEGISYSNERIVARLQAFHEQFPLLVEGDQNFGYIQKVDVPPGSAIFVRADLHGDVRSLLSNLHQLKMQGLLDADYRCRPGFYVVLLGDYADRGSNTMQILELLAALKMENPTQVFLIRGNHEYIVQNTMGCGADPNFRTFLFPPKEGAESEYAWDEAKQKLHYDALKSFYASMTLTLYMGQAGDGQKQYVQFTHGLFEPKLDPAPLLDDEAATGIMPVQKILPERKLSARISSIQFDPAADYPRLIASTAGKAQRRELKLAFGVQQITKFVEKDIRTGVDVDLTAYNWGDVQDYTRPGSLGNRTWCLSPQDVQHYLRLSSAHHKVKMVFRGHQHGFKNHAIGSKVVVTTLPVGMDCGPYKGYFPDQQDRAYMMVTAPKVKNWTKRAILRTSGETEVRVTDPQPLPSEVI